MKFLVHKVNDNVFPTVAENTIINWLNSIDGCELQNISNILKEIGYEELHKRMEKARDEFANITGCLKTFKQDYLIDLL